MNIMWIYVSVCVCVGGLLNWYMVLQKQTEYEWNSLNVIVPYAIYANIIIRIFDMIKKANITLHRQG